MFICVVGGDGERGRGRERYGQVVDIKRMITKNKSHFSGGGGVKGGGESAGRREGGVGE